MASQATLLIIYEWALTRNILYATMRTHRNNMDGTVPTDGLLHFLSGKGEVMSKKLNRLSVNQRVKLYMAVQKVIEDGSRKFETYKELADYMTAVLGFPVTASNVRGLNSEDDSDFDFRSIMKDNRVGGVGNVWEAVRELQERVDAIEQRMVEMERQLDELAKQHTRYGL